MSVRSDLAYFSQTAPIGVVGGMLGVASAAGFWFSVAHPVMLHLPHSDSLNLGSVIGTLFSTLLCLLSMMFERERLVGLAGLTALALLENFFLPINLINSLLLVFYRPETMAVIAVTAVGLMAVKKFGRHAYHNTGLSNRRTPSAPMR